MPINTKKLRASFKNPQGTQFDTEAYKEASRKGKKSIDRPRYVFQPDFTIGMLKDTEGEKIVLRLNNAEELAGDEKSYLPIDRIESGRILGNLSTFVNYALKTRDTDSLQTASYLIEVPKRKEVLLIICQ